MISMLAVAALSLGMAQQQPTDTTFNVPANGTVAVENFGGAVTVRTWERNQVRVRGAHSSRTEIEIEVNGPRVGVEVSGRMGIGQADLELTVPRSYGVAVEGVNTSIDLEDVGGDVDVETVNGNISVRGGRGRIHAEAVQGFVSIENASGRFQVGSVNLGVRLHNVRGDISAETVNGPILMYGIDSRSVDAESVNGAIEYQGSVHDDGGYSLATHNGRILFGVPENANANVSVYTFNGRLQPGFAVEVRQSRSRGQFSFTIGRGGADIELESFGGAIQLVRPNQISPRNLGQS